MKLFVSDISALGGSKQEAQSRGSRLILERALLYTFDITLSQADLVKDANGKPYLKGSPRVHFNLSHSGGLIVCALDDLPLGVDIEKIRPVDPNLPSRVFTAEEAAYLKDLPEKERQQAFFQIWTAKESYMKATGRGFSLPISQILLDWDRHLAKATGGALPSLCFCHYDAVPRFSLCVCSPKDHFPESGEMVWVSI